MTLFQPIDDDDPEWRRTPPRLCSDGQLFANALRRALELGKTDDSFWFVTLSDLTNDKLWIQLCSEAVNVTDALPRVSPVYKSTEPVLEISSRAPGTYSTFTFESPPAVEMIAATICSYMRSMFPDAMSSVTWAIDEAESDYVR